MDTSVRGDAAPAWRVAAVSSCGASHVKLGLPCQDANAWRVVNGDFLAGAVSDGAGSAAFSEEGSRIAVETAVNVICEQMTAAPATDRDSMEALLDQAWQAARGAIEAEALRRQEPARSFAATLIIVASTPTATAVVQIGDGAAVVRNREGEIDPMTLPKLGEYVNETTFLVSPDAAKERQFAFREGAIGQICVFTDGLQALALKLPEGAAHPPFFRPLFDLIASSSAEEAQAEISSFLSSERLRNRADDDLTLFLAHRP